ncbi:MAG: NADH-quinone oxidoreductase subunit H [Phycisphaerae bacterium]|nr:NADH-quinone oxidoreductase subunit H [Phycisphaerae bacterium]
MEVIRHLFWLLVFPGFLFTVILGLYACWIVRKVTALIHHRIGPPVLQPLYDVLKLLGKETLIPEAANKTVFISAPVVGFASVLLLSILLWAVDFSPANENGMFLGDVIVAIYLMVIPSLALILGSSASGSPHAAIGTAREIKLVTSYELVLVMAFIVVLIKAMTFHGISDAQNDIQLLSLSAITQYQHTPIMSISGFLAFLAALLCVQAKLGFTPFDIPEAETEIAGGVLIEYSGALLALWKMMQAIMLVALPLFLVVLFMGGIGTSFGSIALGTGKYVLVLVLLILIKNTNPRMRIDQAVKFFWFYCGPVMAIAIVLAMLGKFYGKWWL